MGFALSSYDIEACEMILNAGNGLFLSEVKLEAATNLILVIVQTAPLTIHKEKGRIEVSKYILNDEIEWGLSIRPAHVKIYGENKVEALHRMWMVYFLKALCVGFRVFNESRIARKFKKQQLVGLCRLCDGHFLRI